MRAALPLLVMSALLSACSVDRGQLRGRQIHVAVLPVRAAAGVVVKAPSGGTVRLLLGGNDARAVLRDALVHGLADLGFLVQDPAVTGTRLAAARRAAEAEGAPLTAGRLARALGVEAVLLAQVRAWDLSVLRSQRRARIGLEGTLYDSGGKLLWEGRNEREVMSIRMYRASQDWRAYVREAAQRALESMP